MMKKSIKIVKRMFAICLAACFLNFGVYAQTPDAVEIADIIFDGNEVSIVTEISTGKQDNIRIIVSKKEADVSANVMWLSETKSDASGKKTFEFMMPDEKNSQDTTGEYKVLAKTDNSGIATEYFDFVSNPKREDTIALINSLTAQDADVTTFKGMFAEGNVHKNAMAVMGAPVDLFAKLGNAQTRFATNFLQSKAPVLTQATAKEALADWLILEAINELSQNEVYELLEMKEIAYDGRKFGELTDENLKSWLAAIICNERPYADSAALAVSYDVANVLYKINNAKYNQFEGLFATNATLLGISGDSAYNEYCNLDVDRKIAANEKIVNLLAANPIKKASELTGVIKTAVDAVREMYQYAGNVGGAGGGGASYGDFPISKGEGSQISIGGGVASTIDTSKGNAEGYTDLDDHVWAKEAVNELTKMGVVSGAGDGLFEPGRNITREEFVKIIVLAAGVPDDKSEISFADVTENDWYYSYIQRAVNAGIIYGKNDTEFGVGEPLTRQDMVVIVQRAFGDIPNSVREEAKFADMDTIADYALKSVKKAYETGVVDGFEDNTFRPYDSCTRAMAAKIIHNVLNAGDSASSTNDSNTADNDLEKYKEEISLLSVLGIYNLPTNAEAGFDANGSVSFETFVGAVLRMKHENFTADVMATAADEGIISSSDKAKGNMNIKTNEAIRVLLKTLGYSEIAEVSGGYPLGYIDTAGKVKLLDGISYSGDDVLTVANMLKLLTNAIDVPMAQVFVDGLDSYTYEKIEGDTLLSLYRNIFRIEGMVTCNEFTSLNDASHLDEKKVKIDNVTYNDENSGASELLGRNVYAYAKVSNEVGTILFAAADKFKNTELLIFAEDILGIDNKCTLIEYEGANEKKEKAQLSLNRRVIYNGVVYNDFTKDDIWVKNGQIKLLDNDGDDVYDVVFVNTYDATILVDYIASFEKLIYNRFESSNLTYLELYEEKKDNRNIILMDGKEISLTDIQNGDVVSVSLSKNANKNIARVYVSRNTFTATINSYNLSEYEITVTDENGEVKVCKVHPVLLDEINSANSKFAPLSAGVTYVFSVDVDGRIVNAQTDESTEWQPIMMLKMYRGDGVKDSEIHVKYMTGSGEWKVAMLREKVEYQNSRMAALDVYNAITDAGTLTPQVAMIKTNKNGDVSRIRTAVVTDEVSSELLTEKTLVSAVARPGNVFGNFEYYHNADSVVFVMPAVLSYDPEDYSTSGSGYFEVNKVYRDVKLYNLDEFKFTNLISVKKNADTALESKQLFLVTDISQELYNEVEVYTTLYGTMGNMSMISVAVEDSSLLASKNITKGDVIQFTTNSKGKIDNINVVYQIEDGSTIAPFISRWDEPAVINFKGTVSKVQASKNRMVVRFDDGRETTFKLQNNTNVNVYYLRTDKGSQQRIADIREGDFIIGQTRSMTLSDVVIIRFDD